MESPYDTSAELLNRLGIKAPDILGEASISLLSRALVGPDNRLAFYANSAGQLVAGDGQVVVAGNAVVDFVTVASAAARFALTTATVRNGDHVKESDTGHLFELVDETAIASAASWVKLRAILATDIADATTAGKTLLTGADRVDQLSALGLNGQVYIMAHFANHRLDERLYISVSVNGIDWHTIHGGQPVYSVPGYVQGSGANVVRDPTIHYREATGEFYVAFTAGAVGTSGYFSVVKSRDLIHWTPVKNVSDPVFAGTAWGPSFFVDDVGEAHVLIAGSTSGSPFAPGESFRIYITEPMDQADWAGPWNACREVDLPDSSPYRYNEVSVFRTPAGGLQMIVFNFTSNAYEILQASNVEGPWTLYRSLGLAPREGPIVLRLADRWRVLTESVVDSNKDYHWCDFDDAWQNPSPLIPIRRSMPFELTNGEVCVYDGPLAPALSSILSPDVGSMARQNAHAVAITGGTLSGGTLTGLKGLSMAAGFGVKVPIHGAWTNGGLIGMAANGTTESWILGNGFDNVLYWGLPHAGGGLSWWNGARSGQIASLSNAGNFQCNGTISGGGALTAGSHITSGGQLRCASDGGWGSGGIRFYDGSANPSAFLGCFNSGQFGMRLGTNGNGLVIYDGTGTALVARVTNSGGWQMNSLKVGGADGATGTTVSLLKHGVATLVAGTVTVGESLVSSGSRILLTTQSLGTVAAPKAVAVTARSAGVSFTITSEDTTDTSTVAWILLEP